MKNQDGKHGMGAVAGSVGVAALILSGGFLLAAQHEADEQPASGPVPYSQQAAEEPDPREEKLQMEELAVDGEELASFEELDADSDGLISRSEAQDSRTLDQSFAEADGDGNGQLDRTEFSAFEERIGNQGREEGGAQTPSGSPADGSTTE